MGASRTSRAAEGGAGAARGGLGRAQLPTAPSRGNKPWPGRRVPVPAAASCGLGWPRGPPAALAGGASRPGARTAASQRVGPGDAAGCLSARAPALPVASLPSERRSCRGSGIFRPSRFSFHKGCILLFQESCGAFWVNIFL